MVFSNSWLQSSVGRKLIVVVLIVIGCCTFNIGHAQPADAVFFTKKELQERYNTASSHWGTTTPIVLEAFLASEEAWPVTTYPSSPRLTYQLANRFTTSSLRGEERIAALTHWEVIMSEVLTEGEIANWYSNTVFLGQGCYGAKNAAIAYFEKDLHDLSLADVALLAVIPRWPSFYVNSANQERAIEDRNRILDQMNKQRVISEQDARLAKAMAIGWQNPLRMCEPNQSHYLLDD